MTVNDNTILEESLDKELEDVNAQLKSIENIMIAENKRRLESNQIMSDYIDEFLDKLQDQIRVKVEDEYQAIKLRVENVDANLLSIETEL